MGFVRRIEDKIREELEEQQRSYAVRAQAAAFKAAINANLPTGMAAAMNPIGKEYLIDRASDERLRPSSFFQTLIDRIKETPRPIPIPAPIATPQPPEEPDDRFGFGDLLSGALDVGRGAISSIDRGLEAIAPFAGQAAELGFAAQPAGSVLDLARQIPGAPTEPQPGAEDILDFLRSPFIPGSEQVGQAAQFLFENPLEAAQREVDFFRPLTGPAGEALGRGAVARTPGLNIADLLSQGRVGDIAGQIGETVLPELVVPSNLIPFEAPLLAGARGLTRLPAAARAASRFVDEAGGVLPAALRQADTAPLQRVAAGLDEFTPRKKPVPEQEVGRLFHETSPREALAIFQEGTVPTRGPAGRSGLFVSDAPDLALGQGGKRGAKVVFRADRVSTQQVTPPGQPPEFAERLGTNFRVKDAAPDAVVEVRFRNDALSPELSQHLDELSRSQTQFGLELERTAEETIIRPRLTPGQEVPKAIEVPPVDEVPNAALPTVLTGDEDPVTKLRILIRAAKPEREITETFRSKELGRRAGRMAGVFERETGESAFIRAQKEQAGALPKADFTPPRAEFSQTEIDDLFDIARVSPKLTPFDRANAGRALFKTLMGELPTRGEIALIGKVWGGELADALLSKRSFWNKFRETTLDVLNIPRSIITAFDLSAPFRQGVLMSVGHPKEFFSNISVMIKSFARQSVADQVDTVLKTGPKARRRQTAGIFHAELDDVAQLSQREEQFMSRLVTRIPVIGSVVKRSQTAYTTYLNKLRADTFDNIVRGWDNSPGRFSKVDEKELADMINKFTGRGNLPGLGQYQGLISQTLFSSRLLASRVQAPFTVFSKSKAVRMQAARDLLGFMGVGMGILGLAKLAGADVNITDSLSANFGKIRVGPTRVDIWGGYQPLVRFAARVATGKSTSSLGNTFDLSRDQAVLNFLRSKLSPQAGFLTDIVLGKTFIGEELQPDPATVKTQAFNRLVPLFIQDMVDAINEQGVVGAGLAGPAFFGVGVQTYVTAAEAERDARREVFAERRNQEGYSQYETLEELIAADPDLLDEIDQDERVIAAQERRNFTSEESEKAEVRVTEFMEQQQPRDDLLLEFYRTGGDTGTSPDLYMDELRDAQQKLFNQREEIFSDIDFGDDPPPEDSVNAAMEAYFAVDMEDFTDKNTREKDFEGFFAAKDGALAPLGNAAGRVRDFISRNFETDTVTAIRKIADGVTDETTRRSGFTYYERDVGKERLDFRRAHPDTDARLFIIGATISVLGARAQKRASELLQQWFGITVRWQDIPKRETTGGVRF